jgi:DNA-3-methyladenine glycosylase
MTSDWNTQRTAGAGYTPVDVGFFERAPDVVAPELLGMILVSRRGGATTGGRIVEVEAYLGAHDPGSHAATKGITKRNAVMYGPPGTAYVYFTYGNHHMLNLVCEPEGSAGAVLIRAIEPLFGLELMTQRRRGVRERDVANGPGKLAQALGVDLSDNGVLLGEGRLSVYHGEQPNRSVVASSGRVGLSSGHELELRWFVPGNPYVSRGRLGPTGRGRGQRSSKEAST